MTRNFKLLLFILSCSSLLLLIPAQGMGSAARTGGLNRAAPPRANCSNNTLKGSYGFMITGPIPITDPTTAALLRTVAIVGVINYDGRGGYSIKATVNHQGGVGPLSIPNGTYTIAPDCTGTLNTPASGPLPPFVFNLVIVDNGKEYFGIQASPAFPAAPFGGVLTSIAKRQ